MNDMNDMNNDKENNDHNNPDNLNNPLDSIFGSIFPNLKNSKQPLSPSQIALKNDRRLEDIIMYKMTEGFTKVVSMPSGGLSNPNSLNGLNGHEDMDNMDDESININQQEIFKLLNARQKFNNKLVSMFKEFKGLIKRGTFTLDQLEDKIYAEYGIVTEEQKIKANPLINEYFYEIDEEEYERLKKDMK